MVAGVSEEDVTSGDEGDGGDAHLEDEVLYSVGEQLGGVAIACAALERLGFFDEEMKRSLGRSQRALRLGRVGGMAQTTSMDHFNRLQESPFAALPEGIVSL